eukprot:CAMPEP_0117423844 /NCGR_PEP_ID=MMETSP0758-20121206/4380_1 /TAXON_ID=63605 /ORGANISM="Percolomonas cosmopolitus, Strain AE-1 (ATCC 50343)" /LENGTH=170 /DNA_ID=CAMNT_0005207263 /DNA_START=585 /DNA_END=1094 /DNA_ORIENTATION=-
MNYHALNHLKTPEGYVSFHFEITSAQIAYLESQDSELSEGHLQNAYRAAKTENDRQLLLFETLRMSPPKEFTEAIIYKVWLNENPKLYAKAPPQLYDLLRRLYQEPIDPEKTYASYDFEVYTVAGVIRVVSTIAVDEEEAKAKTLEFCQAVMHEDANITKSQSPSNVLNK